MVMAVEAEVVGLEEIQPTLDRSLEQVVVMLAVAAAASATHHRTGMAMVDRVQ